MLKAVFFFERTHPQDLLEAPYDYGACSRQCCFLKENDHKGVYVFSKFELQITPIVQEFDLTTNVIDEDLKWSYIKLGKVRKWFPENTKHLADVFE